MRSEPVRFPGSLGERLAGIIDRPDNPGDSVFVLFAHCFTCTKDIPAAARVSSALTDRGYTVLRFDFTGLGESGGDFSDTGFASNLEDLAAAADYLSREHQAPELLIGHSLGGTAAVHAAAQIPSSKAVATIASPYDPEHVVKLLADSVETIREHGEAKVNIGGRPFRIRRAFLDTLEQADPEATVRTLKRALLVLHSPIDSIVGIENAARLFEAARHPKSFVSLDDADHLLRKSRDAHYAGEVIGTWAKRYIQS